MALGLALPQGCLVAGTPTTTRHGPYRTGARHGRSMGMEEVHRDLPFSMKGIFYDIL